MGGAGRLLRLVTGPLDVNTYISVGPGGDCLVVDPGSCVPVLRRVEGLGCRSLVVAVTHGHFDHVGGVDCLVEAGGVLAAHPLEPRVSEESARLARSLWGIPAEPQASGVLMELREGSLLEAGGLRLRVYHTPGHSPDHIILYDREAGLAFTGDLVFAGSVGRVDMPGSSPLDMVRSLERIPTLLEPETTLLPGHGTQTTMARELEVNPFLRNPSLLIGGLP